MSDEYRYQLESFIDRQARRECSIKVPKTVMKEIWKEAWETYGALNAIVKCAEMALKFYIKGREKNK